MAYHREINAKEKKWKRRTLQMLSQRVAIKIGWTIKPECGVNIWLEVRKRTGSPAIYQGE